MALKAIRSRAIRSRSKILRDRRHIKIDDVFSGGDGFTDVMPVAIVSVPLVAEQR